MGQENSHSELSAAPAQWSVRTAVVIVFGSVSVHKEPSDSVKLGALLQFVCAKTPTPSQKNSARCDHNMRVLPHRTLLTRKVMTEGKAPRRQRILQDGSRTTRLRSRDRVLYARRALGVRRDRRGCRHLHTEKLSLFSFSFFKLPPRDARGENTKRGGCGGRVCKVHCGTISTRVQPRYNMCAGNENETAAGAGERRSAR